jgi:serine/threonine protein kinase/tetratricopeptide (TPR) repeat protein
MDDSKSKKRRQGKGMPGSGPPGIGVPAKGDSSTSNAPLDAKDGATISDAPSTRPPPADKPATHVPHPDATYLDDLPSRSGLGRELSGIYMKEAVLNPGDVIGSRYEILQLLGEGGMGAVYKARDREVDRTVALKLIRPELASNPTILARFKQELLTAHQVTHKNVIRIYDIAEADGVKFITMEYVEGSDLRHILIDNGKLAAERAIEIIRQVCLALEAAHGAGVIHRDLKPQNIMQDSKTGRILVMDFGLARSIESEGMTQTGALLGTIEYMSPEQSMGKPLDQRSDIFAVGLIFYELLTGKTPYKADTAMASLLRRNQERAIPAAELDAGVPKGLSEIVSKCLERELANRYQSVQEILRDLDAFQGARPTLASIAPVAVAPPKPALPWKWIGIGSLVLVMLVGGWVLKTGLVRSGSSTAGAGSAKAPELSLAILPFRNASGDSSLDWLGPTLADMLSTGVGQSAQMRVIPPERVQQVLSDLRITPESPVDATMVGHIAQSSAANTVLWGKYLRNNDKIHIEGTLQDLKHDRRYPIVLDAPAEKDISGSVSQIADQIRRSLSVSADAMKELKASSFQPSSKSTLALRDFTEGVQLLRDGRNLDAVKALKASIQEDPNFALAFARLAEANSALGYDGEAERNSRKALDLSQSLPQGERYFIEAIHAEVTYDTRKAVQAYENLTKILPDNGDVEYALGSLYLDQGEYDKSRAQFDKILKADPKNIRALWQMSGVEAVQANAQASLDPLNKALSQAIQTDNQEQKALILQAIGVSYNEMKKPQDAMKYCLESMEISKKLGLKRLQANNLSEVARIQTTLGKPEAAIASYGQALQILRDIGMKRDYGDVLINRGVVFETRGDYDKALQDYKEAWQIKRDTGDENLQALCLSNIGNVYLSKGDTDNALTYLQQSLELRKKLNQPEYLALTLRDLGEAYMGIGDYDKALANLTGGLDASRKANDPSVAADISELIGRVLVSQGRLGAAISAVQDAVKSYRFVQNNSVQMALALKSLADILAVAGRGAEAGKLLDEAQEMARNLKNDDLNSALANVRGDVAFYQGNFKSATMDYQQAAALAAKAKQRETAMVSKMNLARVAIAEGRSQSAITDLRTAVQQAESQHLKYYAVRGSVDFAEALSNTKDYAHAREQLDSALGQSEKLGLRLETVRIQFLLGNVLQSTGYAAEAEAHYREATTLLSELSKESGAEKLTERADLKAMLQRATSGMQRGKN